MEDQAELIRQQMQEKRAELSEKLQTLGEMLPTETVAETVESVSETVTGTAENVQETVKSVQEAFDLSQHVQDHPWLAVGGAVLVGYLAHGALTSSQGGAASLLGEPLRQVEKFATQAAWEVGSRLIQGHALGPYGPVLELVLGQLGGLTRLSSGGPSHNGPGQAPGPAPSASRGSAASKQPTPAPI